MFSLLCLLGVQRCSAARYQEKIGSWKRGRWICRSWKWRNNRMAGKCKTRRASFSRSCIVHFQSPPWKRVVKNGEGRRVRMVRQYCWFAVRNESVGTDLSSPSGDDFTYAFAPSGTTTADGCSLILQRPTISKKNEYNTGPTVTSGTTSASGVRIRLYRPQTALFLHLLSWHLNLPLVNPAIRIHLSVSLFRYSSLSSFD